MNSTKLHVTKIAIHRSYSNGLSQEYQTLTGKGCRNEMKTVKCYDDYDKAVLNMPFPIELLFASTFQSEPLCKTFLIKISLIFTKMNL